MEGRSCGQCEACCFVMGIFETESAPFQFCKYQLSLHDMGGGCIGYANRPSECRNYRCGFLDPEEWPELSGGDQPDFRGIVFDHQEGDFGPTCSAREVWPGASLVGRARELIKQIGARIPIYVVPYGSWKVGRTFCPPHRVDEIRALYILKGQDPDLCTAIEAT